MGKIDSYFGFAVKARKIIYGTTMLSKARNVELIVVCESAGINAKKDAKKYSARYNCHYIETNGQLLEKIVNKANCKICGLTDKGMVQGIIENLSETNGYKINFREDKR